MNQKVTAIVLMFCVIFIGGFIIWNEHKSGSFSGVIADFENLQYLMKSKNASVIQPTVKSNPITSDNVIRLVNEERKKNSLKELAINDKLESAAQSKAEYICEKQFWAHIAPDGTTPWSFIHKAGYSYLIAGENLARDFYDIKQLVLSWMGSQEHKANILKKQYSETGVGIQECRLTGINTTVVVQMFGDPSSGRVGYDQINGEGGDGSYVNPNTPVHCPINSLCGGGTTPLTYAECQNSTCCKLNNGWTFYKEKSQCAQKQKEQGLVSLEGNGVELDGYTDPNKPVHCSISSNCGGGTTPLTYAECQNSICCHMSSGEYVFMKDRSQCK